MPETFELLMSCMHQTDFSLAQKPDLQGVNVLLVNQCETQTQQMLQCGNARMLKTPTRGLSVSRNLAIENAQGDICLFSDDDECFVDHLAEKILEQYRLYPDADILIFKMIDRPARLGLKEKQLKGLDFLKVGSWQISFRRKSVLESGVRFDPKLGAGSGNGVNEENKFLKDCMKAGLKAIYVPVEIASAVRTTSTWFRSFDAQYFYNRGRTTRYLLGLPTAIFYAFYFLAAKRNKYKKDISLGQAFVSIFRGLFARRL